MPVIELKTHIHAPPEICFDLSLDIDLHMQSMKHTNEKVIGGRAGGHIQLGETVKWKANHFGLNFIMTIRIKELSRPVQFVDEMIKGPFKRLRHEHIFEKTAEGTLMTDIFDFKSPAGVLGQFADSIFLDDYLRKLLVKRNELIKNTAEKRAVVS